MKRCARCGEDHPTTEYARHARTSDGLGSYCRTCRAEYSRAWRARNAERSEQLNLRSRITSGWLPILHTTRCACGTWMTSPKPRIHCSRQCSSRAAWPKLAERRRRHSRRLVAEYGSWSAGMRATNPEGYARYLDGMRRTSIRRRRAEDVGDLTAAQAHAVMRSTDTCPLCGITMAAHGHHPDGRHLDHVVPLAIGGEHTLTNVRVICARCNMARPHDGTDL